MLSHWLVEIEDDIISVESADDLRDAILDGYGYPVTLDDHPEKLKVTRLEPDAQNYPYHNKTTHHKKTVL